jgi:tetratricopeptide (TPR) repeat protein
MIEDYSPELRERITQGLAKIQLLVDLGRVNEALLQSQELVHLTNGEPVIVAMLASLMVDYGQLDEAKELFIKDILPKEPNDSGILGMYAYLLFKRKEFTLAQQTIEHAISLEASNAGLYDTLAQILQKQQHLEEAWSKVNEGLALDPMHEGCLQTQASIVLDFYLKGDDAINWRPLARRQLANNPNSWRGHLYKGLMDLMEKDYGLSYQSLLEAKQLQPNLPIEELLLKLHLRENRISQAMHKLLSDGRQGLPSIKITDSLLEVSLLSFGIYLLLSYPLVFFWKTSWWVWPHFFSVFAVCFFLFSSFDLFAILDATREPPGSNFLSVRRRNRIKYLIVILFLISIGVVWSVQFTITYLQEAGVKLYPFLWN